MQYYKLRVDLSTSLSSVVNLVATASRAYCYVVEKLDTNPHIHFYLETLVRNPALRKRIRLLVGSGNKSYSLKRVEKYPIEYLAYLLKEGKPTYVNIPDGVIKDSHVYNTRVREEIKAKKAAKLSKADIITKLMSEAKIPFHIPYVTQYVLNYYKKFSLPIREYQMISLIQTILFRESDGYESVLTKRLLDKIE